MSNYFSRFPTMKYGNHNVYDITRRNKFREKYKNNPLVFLPYTIKDGEKPEDIAYHYYGSVDYTWMVLIANNMLDPYHDWPLDTTNFDSYMIDKYAVASGRKGVDVLYWTQDETSTDNVVYYYKEVDGMIVKTSNKSLTYEYLYTENNRILQTEDLGLLYINATPPNDFIPYRIWDYEFDMNENKREILLVDAQYLPQVEAEFGKLIKK